MYVLLQSLEGPFVDRPQVEAHSYLQGLSPLAVAALIRLKSLVLKMATANVLWTSFSH